VSRFGCSHSSSLRGRCKLRHRSTCLVRRPPARCYHHHHHHHHHQRCGFDGVSLDRCCSCPDSRDRCQRSRPIMTSDRRLSSTPKPRYLATSSPSAALPADSKNSHPLCAAISREEVRLSRTVSQLLNAFSIRVWTAKWRRRLDTAYGALSSS